MLIIVTGTIAPKGDVYKLKIKNSSQRLEQYLDALKKIIEFRPDAKIVFCDNSDYGIRSFDQISQLASDNNMEFEAISFKGDDEAVARQGKGYGEGEIIKYVLDNSKLAAGEDYMIKITGRLCVDNISKIVKKVKASKTYFNVPNANLREFFDTRIYAMPIEIYKQYFIDGFKSVDDANGFIIETVFTDIIEKEHLNTRNFPVYPRIVGVSGSGGIDYSYTEWKCRIKDILSVVNYYGKVIDKVHEEDNYKD